MRNLLWALCVLSLPGCSVPTTPAPVQASPAYYQVYCADGQGEAMIAGEFSQFEIENGGAFSLVSSSGRRVVVRGFCIAIEMRR